MRNEFIAWDDKVNEGRLERSGGSSQSQLQSAAQQYQSEKDCRAASLLPRISAGSQVDKSVKAQSGCHQAYKIYTEEEEDIQACAYSHQNGLMRTAIK
ncbi:hypothetical protein Q5P01_026454 [Channa striata]|uniref:Uncharacterized protein n=1 Tax=Channa striata TaxID=64152 RepID=A0AA88LKH9_CHASR|nr:hypothetical protein Q5P01_026454 [Channa striata]